MVATLRGSSSRAGSQHADVGALCGGFRTRGPRSDLQDDDLRLDIGIGAKTAATAYGQRGRRAAVRGPRHGALRDDRAALADQELEVGRAERPDEIPTVLAESEPTSAPAAVRAAPIHDPPTAVIRPDRSRAVGEGRLTA